MAKVAFARSREVRRVEEAVAGRAETRELWLFSRDRFPPPNGSMTSDPMTERIASEDGIEFRLRYTEDGPATGCQEHPAGRAQRERSGHDARSGSRSWRRPIRRLSSASRAASATNKWTTKNPPNYVARSHVLLGRTVDAGRVWDVIAAAKYLAADSSAQAANERRQIHVAGERAAGVIGAYAALLHREIGSVTLVSPPASHMDAHAPQFLNVLRVCDVPDALGMLAPRSLTVLGVERSRFAQAVAAYSADGAQDRLSIPE